MLRYKLRSLLILLAILPPLLGVAWVNYTAWKAEQERQSEIDVWVPDAIIVPISGPHSGEFMAVAVAQGKC